MKTWIIQMVCASVLVSAGCAERADDVPATPPVALSGPDSPSDEAVGSMIAPGAMPRAECPAEVPPDLAPCFRPGMTCAWGETRSQTTAVCDDNWMFAITPPTSISGREQWSPRARGLRGE